MNKEIKICPAMVRCGESHRNALDGVRTPVAGFLFTPKTSSIMTNEKLNLRPLYELFAVEVDLEELIEH